MSKNLQFTLIDGIKCYSPRVANDYADYPNSGFDLTDSNADSSFWVSSRNRLFKWVLYRNVRKIGKTKFLEIGCGTGNFVQKVIANKRLDITRSEIYLKGLAYAKQHLPDANFIQYDVTEGSIDEQFDVIAAFDVIEHIENDEIALLNIFKMLKSEGVFIVSVPQHMFLWSRLDEMVMHKRRYSNRQLITKLKNCGFDIEYSTSFLFVLFPLMLVSRLLDRGGESHSISDDDSLEKRVRFPKILNNIFDFVMRFDEILIKMGVSLPFGGTLVAIARKP